MINFTQIPIKALHYCWVIKDKSEVRGFITDSWSAYRYCINIEDKPEVRQHITNPMHLEIYNRWKNSFAI
jgi:hypothetical protein